MTDLYYIEDDPAIAGTVKEYLEQRDFTVTICTTLARAKLALKRHVPSLVLLDFYMPDGHGDSLCRSLRSNWKDLPIIMLTVRGDSRDIVSGFEDGADDYVVKPFELEVLHSRIRALLRRAGNVGSRYIHGSRHCCADPPIRLCKNSPAPGSRSTRIEGVFTALAMKPKSL